MTTWFMVMICDDVVVMVGCLLFGWLEKDLRGPSSPPPRNKLILIP